VGGRAYRGKLVVSSDGKTVSVIDVVGLEQYLKGVVPAEMPSGWPAEALKAQAVAARSYALANLAGSGPFDLYGDTRSQVYGGVPVETEAASAAVDATAGQVLTYDGRVADTLFHASSGGRTMSSLEATGRAVPYLVSVKDPYDVLSPYHDWGPLLLDAATAAKALELPAAITGLQETAWPSGRVRSLALTTAGEATASFTGNQLRVALGLRSTWFRAGLLRLHASRRAITWGGSATLDGSAAGVDGVSLEARPVGSRAWAAAAAPVPAADGSFDLPVRPKVSTTYRLAAGAVRVGSVTVAVAPRVAAALGTTGVEGTAMPAAAGVAVELQSLAGSTWATVSSTVTGADGTFAFGGTPAPGTYRVRVAPGHGLVPGVSAPLTVS
jgi:SpoIID/LytB domain protein